MIKLKKAETVCKFLVKFVMLFRGNFLYIYILHIPYKLILVKILNEFFRNVLLITFVNSLKVGPNLDSNPLTL